MSIPQFVFAEFYTFERKYKKHKMFMWNELFKDDFRLKYIRYT
jgi:hypothetical protein